MEEQLKEILSLEASESDETVGEECAQERGCVL